MNDRGIIGQSCGTRVQKARVRDWRKTDVLSISIARDRGSTAFALSCDASKAVLSEMVDTERMYSYQK